MFSVSIVVVASALAAEPEPKQASGHGTAAAFVVESSPGYNAWPMMQAVDGTLVCTYSRGSGHSIGEGRRDVFARVSKDGGRTWESEVVIAGNPNEGEVMIGKGADSCGAALFWVRCIGKTRHHDLYRTFDGKRFEKIASPRLDPMPMQITDVFHVENGLMCLWFATNYSKNGQNAWGTLFSADDGATWVQNTVESGLPLAELPTEPSVAVLGGGRLLCVARIEMPDSDRLAVHGEIGDPPPEGLEQLLSAMLEANHLFAGTAGATISRDHETGRFHLCQHEPLAILDADSLAALVESFVNTLGIWRKAIVSYRPVAKSVSEGSDEGPQLGANGFFRV